MPTSNDPVELLQQRCVRAENYLLKKALWDRNRLTSWKSYQDIVAIRKIISEYQKPEGPTSDPGTRRDGLLIAIEILASTGIPVHKTDLAGWDDNE